MITAKVFLAGDTEYKYLQHDLELGKEYEVERITMGRYYVHIHIFGKIKKYNCACFEFYEDGKSISILADERFNPYLNKLGRKEIITYKKENKKWLKTK